MGRWWVLGSIVLSCFLRPACAGVRFNDARLQAAVEEELRLFDPTPTDMLGLTSLVANYKDIEDLKGLETATNLQYLEMRFNRLSDLSPLSGLVNLRTLYITDQTTQPTIVYTEHGPSKGTKQL